MDDYTGIETYLPDVAVVVKNFPNLQDVASAYSEATETLLKCYRLYRTGAIQTDNFSSYARTAMRRSLINLYRKSLTESKHFTSLERLAHGGDIPSSYDRNEEEEILDTLELIRGFLVLLKPSDRIIFMHKRTYPDMTMKESVEYLEKYEGIPRTQGGLSKRLKFIKEKFRIYLAERKER